MNSNDIKSKMKATILHGPDDLRIEEVDVPDLKPHEVLIKVNADGVCPTGVHAVRNGTKWGPPDKKLPGFPGHELAGEIVKTGGEVEDLDINDRVVSDLIIKCGKCHYCRTGRSNLCENIDKTYYFSWAEYVKGVDFQTYRIPDNVSDEEAAFTEPLACVLHSIKRAKIPLGGNVAILGLGQMGLLHLQLAKNMFGATVVGSDPVENRRELAKSLGADEVFPPSESLPSEVKESVEDGRIDSVIVTVGNEKVQEESLKLVGKSGTIIFYAGIHGVEEPSIEIDPNKVHYGEATIQGSYDKTAHEFLTSLKLISSGVVDLEPLISNTYPLSDFEKAMDALDQNEGIKQIIHPQE